MKTKRLRGVAIIVHAYWRLAATKNVIMSVSHKVRMKELLPGIKPLERKL